MAIGPLPRVSSDHRPMQVRFFQEADIAAMEAAVNTWLALKPRREIVEVHQSVLAVPGGGRELIVSVWYLDN